MAKAQDQAAALVAEGEAHYLHGQLEEAEARFRQALTLDPDGARPRALAALAMLGQGRLAEGFAWYDAWRQLPDAPAPPPDVAPLWSGEPLAGRNLVVWGEEGFGDQIMYARFAPLLAQAGAEVIWVCHPALQRLVQEGLGQRAVAGKGALSIEGADYLAPTSRLPVVFMQRLQAPPPAPYLTPPAPRLLAGARLGVVARGNPGHDNDRHRSLSDEAACELMRLPGAVSLAPEDTGAADFWDTAAIIAGLDLVITVDTSVAHLAGALGKPAFVLLPALGCDWRWQRRRSDSPWYPSLRLFRQASPGDWAGVVAEVRAAIEG